MKERIRQIIELENLSHSDFAKALGVQRSNISHILAGRNKPSIDFVQKLLRRFKNIDADWLIMGEGTMYKNTPNTLFSTNKETEPKKNKKLTDDNTDNSTSLQEGNNNDDKSKNVANPSSPPPNPLTLNSGNPDQILILFDDATFATYKKRK